MSRARAAGGLGARDVAPLGQGAAAAQPAREVAGLGLDRQARCRPEVPEVQGPVDRVGGDPGAVGAEGQPGREAAAAGGRAEAAEHQHLVAGPGVGEVDVAVVPQRRQPLPVRGEPDATDAPSAPDS